MSPAAQNLIEALHRYLDERVEAKLAACGVGEYSTGNLPPRTSRRTFHEWCRRGRVAGAVRCGRGWSCSAGAWRDARASEPRKPPNLSLVLDPGELDPDALLEAAGLRATRVRAGRR